MMTSRSRAAAALASRAWASDPPTSAPLIHGMHRITQCVNGSECIIGSRCGAEHDRPLAEPAWRCACRARRNHPGGGRDRLFDLWRLRGRGDDAGGIGQPAGKVGRQCLVTAHRLRLDPELLGLRQPDRCDQQPEAQHDEARDGNRRHAGRSAGHRSGDAVPNAAVGKGFRPDLRDERPEQPPTEQCEQGRQHEKHKHRRDDQARRGLHPEAARARRRGEQQRQQCEHDGGVAREDRRACLADSDPKCVAVIFLAAQLLSISRDQQQGVVGAGTEHQHTGDAGGRPVRCHPDRLRDRGTDNRRDAVGEADHRERDQPQHRRSVGDDQQQRDHGCGDGQQREVGPGERVRDVGEERRAAGDLDPDVLGQSVVR